MRDAAARLVGAHDFASFAASTGSEDDDRERSTVREIYSTELARSADNEELVFTVRTYATQAPYGPAPSAQIHTRIQLNPQVTALQDRRTRNSDKSQVKSNLVLQP